MILKGRSLILFSFVFFGIFLAVFNPFFAILAGIISYILPAYLKHRKEKAFKETFREQLIDAVELIAGALKSGMTFQQALVYVIAETKEPISSELKSVMEKVMLGVGADKALFELAEKRRLEELFLLSSALAITKDAGGNLAEVLKNICSGLRDRLLLEKQIEVLTAQGKLSGLIVGGLPFAILILMYLVDKELILPMFNSFAGWILLGGALLLELTGALFIRKIVQIDY